MISCSVAARVVVGPSLMWFTLRRVVVIGGAGGARLSKSAGNQIGGVREVYLVHGSPGACLVAGSGAAVGAAVADAPGCASAGSGGRLCCGGGCGGGSLRGGVSSVGAVCPFCVPMTCVTPGSGPVSCVARLLPSFPSLLLGWIPECGVDRWYSPLVVLVWCPPAALGVRRTCSWGL